MTNNNVKNVQLYELKEKKINTRGNQNLSTQLTKTILSNNAYLLMRLLHCSIYLKNNTKKFGNSFHPAFNFQEFTLGK